MVSIFFYFFLAFCNVEEELKHVGGNKERKHEYGNVDCMCVCVFGVCIW